MKKTLLAILPVATMLWTAACTQAPPPAPPDTRAADLKAIEDADAMMSKQMQGKMWDKMESFYAEDAVLMTPGAPAAVGREAIKGMAKMMADNSAELNFHSTKSDVSKSGELGYVQGVYTLAMTDPKTKKHLSEKGNYLTVYKKAADGSWKIAEDINAPDADPVSK